MAHGVIKRDDGGISVVVLAPGNTNTVEQEIAMLKSRGDMPHTHELVAKDIDMPDRHWREAWTWTTPEPVIDIDMDKAVEVTKKRLRQEREPKLADLDVQFNRALESNDEAKKADIVAEKNVLRDVTKKVHNKLSLDEMRAITV